MAPPTKRVPVAFREKRTVPPAAGTVRGPDAQQYGRGGDPYQRPRAENQPYPSAGGPPPHRRTRRPV
ncbi:hypothetical protein ACE1SV_33670 [Streptomyces sp. E-15]